MALADRGGDRQRSVDKQQMRFPVGTASAGDAFLSFRNCMGCDTGCTVRCETAACLRHSSRMLLFGPTRFRLRTDRCSRLPCAGGASAVRPGHCARACAACEALQRGRASKGFAHPGQLKPDTLSGRGRALHPVLGNRKGHRESTQNDEISSSLDVMNSRSAGTPSSVFAMPRRMAGTMSSGSVIRSP